MQRGKAQGAKRETETWTKTEETAERLKTWGWGWQWDCGWSGISIAVAAVNCCSCSCESCVKCNNLRQFEACNKPSSNQHSALCSPVNSNLI